MSDFVNMWFVNIFFVACLLQNKSFQYWQCPIYLPFFFTACAFDVKPLLTFANKVLNVTQPYPFVYMPVAIFNL